MPSVIVHLRSQLPQRLSLIGLKYEIDKTINEVTADIYVKAGFLSKTAIFFVEKMNNETLHFAEQIKHNFKYPFKKSIIIIAEKRTTKFWLDVISIYENRNKDFLFINLGNRKLIGEVPGKIRNVLTGMSFGDKSLNAFAHHSIPVMLASPEDTDGDSTNDWLQCIADTFKKYLASCGYEPPKSICLGGLTLDLVGNKGFIFVPEITDEIVDKGRRFLDVHHSNLERLMIIGSTAQKNVLDQAGDGISIYALHRNYQWVSGEREERDTTFGNFLYELTDIKLVEYERPGPSRPFLIPVLTATLTAIIAIIGINYLSVQTGLTIFGIVSFMSVILGILCSKWMKVGEREYTPAMIYAGLAGLVFSGIIYWITLEYQIGAIMGKNFQFDDPFLFVQATLLVDFSVASGIIYTAFTRRRSSYIQPLPNEYNNIAAGKNLTIIDAAINSWDRGWALTIPDLGSKISIKIIKPLTGYAAVLDSLFEERWVTVGERSCSYCKHETYFEAEEALAPKLHLIEIQRWSFEFQHSPRFDAFKDHRCFINMSESCICPDCWGSGRVTCGGCGGSGIVTVYETEYYKEHYIDSEGRSQSRTVSRSVPKQKTCPTCGGSGTVTCPRCGGTGNIEIFPVLNCKRYYNQHKTCVDPTTDRCIDKVIYQAKAKRVIETPIRAGLIQPDTILSPDIPQDAANLVLNVTNDIEELQSNQLHVIRQRLIVVEVPISEVEYTYKTKEYRLWVYGFGNRVYALKSPKNMFRFYLTIIIILVILGINIAILGKAGAVQEFMNFFR